jgi:predicted dehydrogenase
MTNRRKFIKNVTTAMAVGIVTPSLFSEKAMAASNTTTTRKINIGLIGCRSMGNANLRDFLILPEIECIALCDLDPANLEKTAATVKEEKGNTPKLFKNYKEMLKTKEIDAVVISTPDHWHCLHMVDSCAAGKDVYVEKPIANSIAECDVMVAAAKKYNRIVNVGQQQRSGKHWNEMITYLNSGELGKIMKVDVWANFKYAALSLPVPDSEVPDGIDYDAWLGHTTVRPFNKNRFHGSWRMFWDYGGGLMTDWGVHLLDMALWGMKVTGMPNRVVATGGKFAFPENSPETFDTQNVSYEFDDFLINWSHITVESDYFGRNYGVAFRGMNGILVADRNDWEVIPNLDAAKKPKIEVKKVIADGREHKDHVKNFVECLKMRNPLTPCTIENGSLCAKYAHLGNIAARTKAVLTYDDTNKTFNNTEADKFIRPEYRSPYIFPTF